MSTQGEQFPAISIRDVNMPREGKLVHSVGEAAQYLSRRLSSNWEVTMPLAIDPALSLQVLRTGGGRPGVSLRNLGTGLILPFTGDYYEDSYRIVALHARGIEPYGGNFMTNGLAIVHAYPESQTIFAYGVKREHGIEDEAEIEQRMSAIAGKVAEFSGGVAIGMEVPPYTKMEE